MTYPNFKLQLIKNIHINYDDELRIFLVSILREISYLKNVAEEVLIHLSMSMVAFNADKDSFLYNPNDMNSNKTPTHLTIIYEGKLQITTNIEKTDLAIDYIGRGCILNAHNFLSSRPLGVSVKCITAVTHYYLPYDIMKQLSSVYPELKAGLNIAQKQAISDKMQDINVLDYQETNFNIADKIPAQLDLTEAEIKKVPVLRLQMKNAVMHYLLQRKKLNQQNSLIKILELAAKEVHRKKVLKMK